MATYALIHGLWHTGWCWAPLAEALEAQGHRALALTLPGEDPEATFSTYADVVTGALAGEEGDVRLVAHSMGGMTAALVAAARPVTELIYLCALLPEPGRSYLERVRGGEVMHPPGMGGGAIAGDATHRWWSDEDGAIRELYADCDPETARAAARRLRPQALAPYRQVFPLAELPAVPSRYLLCREDRIVLPEWSRAAAPRMLGVEAVEWPGGHSPMLARPGELAGWIAAAG